MPAMKLNPSSIERHRNSQKVSEALAVFALVGAILLAAKALQPGPQWITSIGVGLCALITVRATVNAAMHRWAREAATAIVQQQQGR